MNNRCGQQLGNYLLTRLLGHGGFAEVYLAEHVHLMTSVAMKLLYGKLTAQDIQAFVGEAQILASLKHPSILRVLDFGFEQMLPFLVMDYAPGGTLRDRHPSGSIAPLPAVLAYVKQMASALAYAHSHKIIHRDVKPENMLIDEYGNILLGDFGIVAVAHSTASVKTIDNTGTVHYMAPEQIQGRPHPASDQYALAVTVYEWLCGERPFTGSSPIEIAMRHLTEKPLPLRRRVPTIFPEVEQVVLTALSKDPMQRFPDILSFSDALMQACKVNHSTQATRSGKLAQVSPVGDRLRYIPLPVQYQAMPSHASVYTERYTERADSVYQSLAEEKILLTCIEALSIESVLNQAEIRLKVIREMIREHAAYFQQPEREKRVLNAFYQALAAEPKEVARPALIMGLTEFLSLCGHYVDALLAHIKALQTEYLPSQAETHLEMMTEMMREHREYLLQTGQGKMIVDVFDRALASDPPNAGRFALTLGKAEFLKLYRNYEELLLTLIASLPAEYLPGNAERQLKMLREIVREHAEYFLQIGRGKKILDAFDRALASDPQDVARFALTVGKVELLELYGNYEEILITHIQALPAETLSTHAEAQLKMMREVVSEHADYFELPDNEEKMIEAFDRALAANPREAGKSALVTGKEEFLKLIKKKP